MRLPERWFREPPGPSPEQRLTEAVRAAGAAIMEMPEDLRHTLVSLELTKWGFMPEDVRARRLIIGICVSARR